MTVLITFVCILKRGCIVDSVRGVLRLVQRLDVVHIPHFDRHIALISMRRVD